MYNICSHPAEVRLRLSHYYVLALELSISGRSVT